MSDPAKPGRPCRLPQSSAASSAELDPIQRLLAFAYMQAQKDRREVEELRKDSTALSAVISVQHRIAALQLELEPTLDLIAEEARRLTRAGGAAIALRDGEQVVCRASSGLIAPEVGARLNPHSGISGECLRSGDIQHVEDTETDPRVDQWVCRNLGMRSILAVPLRRQQEVLGILEVFSGWAGVFGEREVRTLRLLAGLVIEALWSWEVQVRPAPTMPNPVDWTPEAVAELLRVPTPLANSDYRLPSTEKPAISTQHSALAPQEPVQSLAQAPQQIVVDETVAVDEAEVAAPAGDVAAPTFSLLPPFEPRPLGRVLAVLAVGVALLAIGSEVVLWHGTHLRPAVSRMRAAAFQRHAVSSPPVLPGQAAPGEPQPAEPVLVSEKMDAAPARPAQLTSIKYWTKAESTTVGVFLDAPARWQSGDLSNPDRIYFDLENTHLPAEMLEQSLEGAAIQVDDGLVKRIWVAPKDQNGVRVVVDLAGPAEHSAVLSPAEPYRLMISVRGTTRTVPAVAEILPVPKKVPAAELRNAGKPTGLGHSIKIVIDPGHGGTEDGAVGPSGLKEKDLVLAISKHLGELLSNRLGVEVIYTRADDRYVPLEMRAVVANEARADLLISVHANYSSDLNARGVETYYVDNTGFPSGLAIAAGENAASRKNATLGQTSEKKKFEESRKLAIEVQRAMYRAYGGKGLNRGVRQAPFVVLLDAEMPSILAEVAFVSSTADEQWLTTSEGQAALAEGLYRGITRYLSTSKYGKVVASLGTTGVQ